MSQENRTAAVEELEASSQHDGTSVAEAHAQRAIAHALLDVGDAIRELTERWLGDV
jgi:hypothetical protein